MKKFALSILLGVMFWGGNCAFENGKKKQRQELAEYIETLRNN